LFLLLSWPETAMLELDDGEDDPTVLTLVLVLLLFTEETEFSEGKKPELMK
jgi:hypothetical protein